MLLCCTLFASSNWMLLCFAFYRMRSWSTQARIKVASCLCARTAEQRTPRSMSLIEFWDVLKQPTSSTIVGLQFPSGSDPFHLLDDTQIVWKVLYNKNTHQLEPGLWYMKQSEQALTAAALTFPAFELLIGERLYTLLPEKNDTEGKWSVVVKLQGRSPAPAENVKHCAYCRAIKTSRYLRSTPDEIGRTGDMKLCAGACGARAERCINQRLQHYVVIQSEASTLCGNSSVEAD
eukprot:14287-Heterococcus_DN1.PRE.2